MTDPDRLAEIREYLDALYGANVAGPKDLIDIRVDTLNWLVGKVDRLRDLLARLEWACDNGQCPACKTMGHPGLLHAPGCWLAAELRTERP